MSLKTGLSSRFRFLIGSLGLEASTIGRALCRGIAIDKLDHGQSGIVTVAEASLHDAQISAVTVCVARRNGVEQTLHQLVIADLGNDL